MSDPGSPTVADTAEAVTATPDAAEPPRPLLPRLLALWALFGVGITQPILDLYGKNPEVFIAGRATRTEIILFALVATLGPLVLATIVLLGTKLLFGDRAQSIVFNGLLGVAGFTAASAVFRQLFPGTGITALMAVGVAVGLVALYVKVNAVRMWLSVLAVLPAAALVMFLFFSESSELVWQAEASADPTVVVDNPVPVVLLVLDEFPLSSIVTPRARSTPRCSRTSPASPSRRTGSRTPSRTRSRRPTACPSSSPVRSGRAPRRRPGTTRARCSRCSVIPMRWT